MTSQRMIGCGVDLVGLLCACLIVSALGIGLNAAIYDAIVTSEIHGCHRFSNNSLETTLKHGKLPVECKKWFAEVWPGYGALVNNAMHYSCTIFSPVGHLLAFLAAVTFFVRGRRVTEATAMFATATSLLLIGTGLGFKAAATQKDGERELNTILKCFIAIDAIGFFVVLLALLVCIFTENKKNDEYD